MKILIQLFLLGQSVWALSVGDPAPNFTAKNQNGKAVHLSDYKGKYVLLYFYPKDETRGCTIEAETLRDKAPQFGSANAVILGVSRQDEKSHQNFKEKHKIPFDLLVDKDGALAQQFGVGQIPVIGLLKRQSVLIDPEGKVARLYDSVDPAAHAEEVLGDIRRHEKSVKK